MQPRQSTDSTVWRRPLIPNGRPTDWGWIVRNPWFLDLGEFTDIGAFTLIVATYGVTIGERTQIGSHCAIYTEDTEGGLRAPVRIGKYVRIGTHSTIMPGVTIGDHAVIGAYSLVKWNVPARGLAYGVPAKVMKEGYVQSDEETSGDRRWLRSDRQGDQGEDA